MKIAIRNGRLIDPANGLDKITSVFIENEKIAFIGDAPSHFTPDLTLDASEKWVIPGLVDTTCHALEHEVALKRGITSQCLATDQKLGNNKSAALQPTLYSIGALTSGERMNDYAALQEAGCIALSAQETITDLKFLMHCYTYAASLNLPIIVQPQETSLLGGVAHQGIVATRLGLPSIPEEAETVAIAKHLLLAEKTAAQIHFTCLSTGKAVEQIREAKSKGLRITCDVAIHSLHLTENDIADFNTNCHVIPPLRQERDRTALLEGVKDKTIDSICSDHRPLDSLTKLAPFAETTPGMSTLDTLLSLGVHLVHQYNLSPSTLIAALSFHPAQCFNLPCGTLSQGAIADLLIIDPQQYWSVEKKNVLSKGKNTPFIGWELPGVVSQMLRQGKVIS